MATKDALGSRMKEFYENIPKNKLIRRCPVAMRIDGKAFHTFTRKFKKPFDEILIKSMQDTMLYLCKNIQGCVFGYTQSDEITLILIDYQKLDSSAWFDYEVQKMCSIGASMATLAFNKAFEHNWLTWESKHSNDQGNCANSEDQAYWDALVKATMEGAMFDCRAFNIPKEEVTNLVYWRQIDATKNSIQMVGRAYFSHKDLHKKNTSDIQDMLHEQYGINWNNFPTEQKRGSACLKDEDGKWYVDHEMPILKGENRAYVDNLVYVGEDETPKRICVAKIDPKSFIKRTSSEDD